MIFIKTSILNKLKTLNNIVSPILNSSKFALKNSALKTGEIASVSSKMFINVIEKYKGIRRIILLVVLWINIHIFFVTKEMYKTQCEVDMQWIIYAGYWSTILATFIGFYTMSRVKEFNSNSQLAPKGRWIEDEQDQLDNKTTIDDSSMIEERIEIDGDAKM